MQSSVLIFKKLAVTALVLMVLVFMPLSSQAATVIYSKNTATGINDLEYNGVLYDITFVYQTGNSVYGPKGEGEFPFAGLMIEGESASTEEATYGASRAIQEALNAASDEITRVGPKASNYFLIAAGEENTDPGNTSTPWVYAAFASAYYDTITMEKRPPETWVPADTFFIEIDIDLGGGWPPIKIEGEPWPLGMAPPLEQDVPYSWAIVEYAGEAPASDAQSPADSIIEAFCIEVAELSADAYEELDEATRDSEECVDEYNKCSEGRGIREENAAECIEDVNSCSSRANNDQMRACDDFRRGFKDAYDDALRNARQAGVESRVESFLKNYSEEREACLAPAADVTALCVGLTTGDE